jgi:class 3 adenylate cyclase/tetratricopeptide (TPR) repeat protein
MHCSRCQHDNPPSAKFCLECGAAQAAACAACGTTLPTGAKFCSECAAPVASGGSPAEGRAPAPRQLAEKILGSGAALEGERKQVTVLCADVKGSIDPAEQLEPEDLRRILDCFLQIVANGVHRFEGTVSQQTGDGLMALFGAPIAHEDHAPRACWAALHLREELRQYADELRVDRGLSFEVRMGLNSGEVVIGKTGDPRIDHKPVGHTVALAQRVGQLAQPGSICLTEHTAQLVTGLFQIRELGPVAVKGARERVRVAELEGAGSQTRADAARTRRLSRFVGRNAEMATLEAALEGALVGRGRVVGIVGGAGVGKSRLCHELAERCRARGIVVAQARCVPSGKDTPFLPWMERLRAFFGVTEKDGEEAARDKIVIRMMRLDEELRDAVPMMLEFLGVPDPNRPGPQLEPEARQRRLFGITKRLMQARSRRGEAALNIFEDLHWIDGGSDAFLTAMIDAAGDTRTLVLVNFRPGYQAPWMRKPYYQEIALAPFGVEASTTLLHELLGDDPSLAGLAEHIRDRTGGDPLFIEEAVQSLVESGSLAGARGALRLVKPIESLEIPHTVQAQLAARIDRLADREKTVLATAAVIGNEFHGPILGRIAGSSDAELTESLQALARAELLYETAVYPAAQYAFKHPLTQEVAHDSQPAERRTQVHRAVVGALAEVDAARLDERAAVLAFHCEAGGQALEAARWHGRAARWAGSSDARQALRHWQKVRALLDAVPESEETRELAVHARAWILEHGWRLGISEAEAAKLFAEGRAIAARTSDPRLAVELLLPYGAILGFIGKLAECHALSQEAVALTAGTDDEELRGIAQASLALSHLIAGRPRDALAVCDEALARAGNGAQPGLAVTELLLHRGRTLLDLGRFDEAAQVLERGRAAAQARGDAVNLVLCLGALSRLGSFRGDALAALDHARRAAQVAEASDLSIARARASFYVGSAERVSAEWAKAAATLEQALTLGRETRTGYVYEPIILAELARARLGLRDVVGALARAEEAVEAAERYGTRVWGIEAHLALAEVLLRTGSRATQARVEETLDRAASLVEETGAGRLQPWVLVRRAELAALAGDADVHLRELRAAHRLFATMGAALHAEHVAKDFG